MEFGIFLNGYIPGPAAHSSDWEHRELMREAEYAIFADKHNWKYAWFGEHHCADRVQPHVGARGRHGLGRRADRLHPPRHRHQQPVAAQGAPGSLRRARGDARPRHRPPLRVGHRPRRRQPRDGEVQHPRHELDQGRVGRGRPRDPAHVGAGRLLAIDGEHFTVPTPHNVLPEALRPGPPADLGGVRQPAAPSRRPASSASARSRSTSSRSTTSGAASRPTRKASPTAPSRSGSS